MVLVVATLLIASIVLAVIMMGVLILAALPGNGAGIGIATVGVYAAAGRRTKTSGTDSKTRAGRKETHKPVSKIIPKYVKEN